MAATQVRTGLAQTGRRRCCQPSLLPRSHGPPSRLLCPAAAGSLDEFPDTQRFLDLLSELTGPPPAKDGEPEPADRAAARGLFHQEASAAGTVIAAWCSGGVGSCLIDVVHAKGFGLPMATAMQIRLNSPVTRCPSLPPCALLPAGQHLRSPGARPAGCDGRHCRLQRLLGAAGGLC